MATSKRIMHQCHKATVISVWFYEYPNELAASNLWEEVEQETGSMNMQLTNLQK